MQAVVRTAPDPYMPVVGWSLHAGAFPRGEAGGSLQRRRAQILAATRRSLATEGYGRFTLRSISDASSVSTQTIHNCFGCKSDLLQSALNQHTVLMDSMALSEGQEPSVFLRLALLYCQSAVDYPEFIREYMCIDMSIRSALMKFGADIKIKMLQGMAAQNLLRPTVNLKIAAEQIAYVNCFGMLEWADNNDICQLYDRLVNGNANILMGILQPGAARDFEIWLSNSDNIRMHFGGGKSFSDNMPMTGMEAR